LYLNVCFSEYRSSIPFILTSSEAHIWSYSGTLPGNFPVRALKILIGIPDAYAKVEKSKGRREEDVSRIFQAEKYPVLSSL
jgi:hypothetical protein